MVNVLSMSDFINFFAIFAICAHFFANVYGISIFVLSSNIFAIIKKTHSHGQKVTVKKVKYFCLKRIIIIFVTNIKKHQVLHMFM